MTRPARHADPSRILSLSRTFFVTTKASRGRALLQSERNATLLIDVLRSYMAARKFRLPDFVVMLPYRFTYWAKRKSAGAKVR